MVSANTIRELANRVAKDFDPDKIILLGSYAYGSPSEDSDVDLLVILNFEGKSFYKSLEILNKANPRFPVDLIARQPEEAERRYAQGDPLIREAYDKGRFCMNDVIDEWREKAEGDFLTAVREFGVTDRPNYDAVCFHAQQRVEKLMKAVLTKLGQEPPRTHHLVRLNELLESAFPKWSWSNPDLRLLDRAAVGFRYPGESADYDEAKLALEAATTLRNALLKLLAG